VVEAFVLVGASLLATALRFILYRWWVFRPRQAPPRPVTVERVQADAAVLARLPAQGQAASS